MDSHNFKTNRLARKLTTYVVLMSFIAILASSSIQLYLSYRANMRQISTDFALVKTGHLDSLIDNVWVYNDKQVGIQLDGMLSLPSIEKAYINIAGNTAWSSGAIESDSTIEHKFELIYQEGNRQQRLGTLFVIAGLNNVYKELLAGASIALMVTAVTVFLFATIILVIFRKLVTRHLATVAHFVNRLDMEKEGESLRLKRPASANNKEDELDHVVSAINNMRQNLLESTRQLRINQTILNKSQEIAKLGSWHLDIEKNILSWSDEQYRIFGKTPQKFGATYEAFLDAIHPDDRGRVDKAYSHAITNKTPYECIHRIIRDDGEVRVVIEKSEDIANKSGQITHSFGFTQDITEQFFESQRYENIIKTSIDGFWVVDNQSRIVDVNEAYCKMVGFSREEILQFSIANMEAKESAEEVEQHVKMVIKNGSGRFESKHRKKDGNLIDVDISVNYSSQAGGDFFVFIRDISERKRADRERVMLETRLVQAQKMEAIGTLAGGIAHDFNNILGIILGYSQMAIDDAPADSRFKKDVEKVLTAANRAKDLVKQILAFSRQSQVERIPLKIQAVIKEGLNMLRSSIPSTISITKNIDSECGVILADPTQIHQILMNLCTNAYQAMEERGGTLSVSLKTTVIGSEDKELLMQIRQGEYVQLTVSDTGAGIRREDMEKIFNPYFTTKGIGTGTGLGLAIIHGIMADYGGTITVESEWGLGTTFHIYFPLIKQQELKQITVAEEIPKGTARILFIDDEELLLEVGQELLERQGYQVTSYQSSVEALAIFQNNPDKFDLVITDQTMPGMTGSELAQKMLQIRPDIPIILCTGYSNLVNEESVKVIGIKEFVLKPLTQELITNLVNKVLKA